MKVALVSEWLDAWRGGAETSTRQFIQALLDAGIELDVFTRSRPSPLPGMRVHVVGGAAMTRTRRSITFALRVDNRIRMGAYDLVHAISPCLSADLYQPRGGTVAESVERNLALLKNRSLRHLKRVANHLNFKQRYLLSMERKLFAPGGRVVIAALSDYVIRQLHQHYAVGNDRIVKVFNGVAPDTTPPQKRDEDRALIRREYGVGPNDLLAIMVAHNYRLKGVARWMEALSQLTRRNGRAVRSLVIGKSHPGRWRQSAYRLGIADRLTFTGPTGRVRAFLHAADVLVHPTYYDPCSRVVLEGMVSGLPCITTKWDGASEKIKDGWNGYVLEDENVVADLVRKTESLYGDENRRAMGRHAALIAEEVSMARHAAQMIDVYKALVSRCVRSTA